MNGRNYVISILKVQDCNGRICEPFWVYASYDRFKPYIPTEDFDFESTGVPCFDSLSHALKYSSVAEAEKEFTSWWKGFTYCNPKYSEEYDLKSLAIRKITFTKRKRLMVK